MVLRSLPVLTAVFALAPLLASAQAGSTANTSRIASITLYPGSATVQRSLRIAAGSRTAAFACLPAQLDARSLQVAGTGAVRIGDISVQVMDRQLAEGCESTQPDRLRAAEDALAQARADVQALELTQTYLKSQASNAPGPGAAAATATQMGPMMEALRRHTRETQQQLHLAQRTLQEKERALKRLQAEPGNTQAGKVAMVRITLAAPADAQLQLSYQVRGPSWSPSYRASLDSRTARVRIERLALVAQDTGEDWGGVQLTLSTGQPLAATSGRLPRPWTLNVQPPMPAVLAAPAPTARMAAAAPALKAADAEAAEPSFDVAVSEGSFATTFAVPQRVSVPTGGEKVTLALGEQTVDAALIARTTPALEPAAYLVAQMPPLAGIWPAGPVALLRDGAYVGQGQFNPGASDWEKNGLSFGRDERILVTAEPVKDHTANAGFTGGRIERTLERAYQVENRHERAIALQVLDAAPISKNDAIRVQSSYEPAPQETAWGGQEGSIAWQRELAAGATARFAARHVVEHDKDVRVQERH